MRQRLLAFFRRADRHGLLGTGGAMLAARGVSVLTGIGLAVLLARTLGAEGYGVYIFALTLAFMLSMPVQMGLPTLLMRQVAIYRSTQDWAHLGGIVRWSGAFVALSMTTVGLAAGGYLLLHDVPDGGATGTTHLYSLTLLLVGILCLMQIAAAILHGFERVFLGSLPDSVLRPVLLLILVLGVSHFVDLSPVWAMGLHAVAATIALGWAAVMVARHCRLSPSGMPTAAPRFETRAWVASLLPLTVVAGAGMLNSKIDLFMLGLLSTREHVGNYGLALQMAGLVVVVQTIVNAMISPAIARLYNSGLGSELQTLVTYACRVSALGALACVVAIHAFGEFIIDNLVGSGFADAADIVLIISVGLLFAATLGPAPHILNMTGHERITARTMLCSAALNAGLNTVLIPSFGAHGAAVALVASVVFNQAALVGLLRKHTGIDSTAIGLQLRRPSAAPMGAP